MSTVPDNETPVEKYVPPSPLSYWEKVQDPRITCPTCNGKAHVCLMPFAFSCECDPLEALDKCPDCLDGNVPLAKLVAIGAAVMDTSGPKGDRHHEAIFARLRAVKP